MIPLAPLALAQLPTKRDGKPYLFGRTAAAGFSGWSKAKTDLDTRLGTLPGGHWTLHDLRRTASTMWMADTAHFKANEDLKERALNHKRTKLSRTYDVADVATRLEERRAMLEAWAAWVAAGMPSRRERMASAA